MLKLPRWCVSAAPFGALVAGRAPVHRGLVLSGDRFVSTAPKRRAAPRCPHDALAVEMEGAAVAQVCHDYGVPFAAVRTISDRADDAAHGDFPQFVQDRGQPLRAAHRADGYEINSCQRFLISASGYLAII
jgi:5'-methylthioadenosine/S-adenosylhomocysteine nucleosidase